MQKLILILIFLALQSCSAVGSQDTRPAVVIEKCDALECNADYNACLAQYLSLAEYSLWEIGPDDCKN